MQLDRRQWITTLSAMGSTLVAVFSRGVLAANSENDPPIYCRLTSAEMRTRLGELRADFLLHVKRVDELEHGFRYWFDKTPQQLDMLAKFIDFESECCAFFSFDLSLAPGAERISLSLTGPNGAKEFLESTMTSVEFDWKFQNSS